MNGSSSCCSEYPLLKMLS